MEHGIDRHGMNLDQQLAVEARELMTAWRDPDLGEPDGRDPRAAAAPRGMTESDVSGRHQLARHLRRSEFPANADQVRAMARDAMALDNVMEELSRLPSGTYKNISEVWSALGHGVEEPRARG